MKDSVLIDGVKFVPEADLPDEEDRENNPNWPWVIGASYMIRTVTFHDHGILVGITDHEIVLKKAAWIPDSGRWWNFITGKSKPSEVEPFGDQLVIIGRGTVVDATQLSDSFGVQK